MFLIVFNTDVLRFLFGQEYLMASRTLVICAIAMVGYYALPIANNVLNAGFKQGFAATNMGIALICNIFVSIILVQSMGEKSPAIGLVVGASTALILDLMVIHRKIAKISWWCAVLKPVLSVLFAVTVTWNLKQFGGVAFGAGLLILCAFYAGLKMFNSQELGYFARAIPWPRKS